VGGSSVELGPHDELDAKLLAVRTVLTQVDLACPATIDVRVPSVPVLTRAGNCGTVSTTTGG
jgi:hypothetical protein